MADFIDWNKPYTGVGRNDRELGIQKLGYTGSFGQGAADKFLTDTYGTTDLSKINAAPGVKPLTVASQNPYQQNALYNMGQPSAPIDSRIGASYDKASSALDSTAKPYDYGSINNFLNPYIDQVVNRNADNVRRQYDISRNKINEASAEAGGFGSTALGVERGLNTEAQNRQIGDYDAQLRSQGYNSAVTNSLNLYNADRTAGLSRANAYTGIGNDYQNLDQYGRNVTANDQNRQLTAGNQIQSQNQAELDAYYKERDRELGYPYQQLDFLQGILKAYPTGSTVTQTQPGVGVAQGAIGGGLLGYDIQNTYNKAQQPVPWQKYNNNVGPGLGGLY